MPRCIHKNPRVPNWLSSRLLSRTLTRLPASRGLSPFMVKRDDLTGVALSGNKVRKLEYLAAQALEQGCDTLVTHGGHQSNHCRATAAVGAMLGLKVRLFLRKDAETLERVGNLFLDELLGAELSFHEPEEYNIEREALTQRVMEEQRALGRKPYFFPVGWECAGGNVGLCAMHR